MKRIYAKVLALSLAGVMLVAQPFIFVANNQSVKAVSDDITNIQPKVTFYNINENDALAGTFIGEISMPDGFDSTGVTYRLKQYSQEEAVNLGFSNEVDVNQYSYPFEVVGNKIKIRDNAFEGLDKERKRGKYITDVTYDSVDVNNSYNDDKYRLKADSKFYIYVEAVKDNKVSKSSPDSSDFEHPFVIGVRVKDNNDDIEKYKPIIKVNVNENSALPGATVATLSMPEQYKGKGYTYEFVLKKPGEEFDNPDDFNQYANLFEIKGNKVKIKNDVFDDYTGESTTKYIKEYFKNNNYITNKNDYADKKFRFREDSGFYLIIEAQKGDKKSKPLGSINEPLITIGKKVKDEQTSKLNGFNVKGLWYYIGDSKDGSPDLDSSKWEKVSDKYINKINQQNGTVDDRTEIKIPFEGNNKMVTKYVYIKAEVDKDGVDTFSKANDAKYNGHLVATLNDKLESKGEYVEGKLSFYLNGENGLYLRNIIIQFYTNAKVSKELDYAKYKIKLVDEHKDKNIFLLTSKLDVKKLDDSESKKYVDKIKSNIPSDYVAEVYDIELSSLGEKYELSDEASIQFGLLAGYDTKDQKVFYVNGDTTKELTNLTPKSYKFNAKINKLGKFIKVIKRDGSGLLSDTDNIESYDFVARPAKEETNKNYNYLKPGEILANIEYSIHSDPNGNNKNEDIIGDYEIKEDSIIYKIENMGGYDKDISNVLDKILVITKGEHSEGILKVKNSEELKALLKNSNNKDLATVINNLLSDKGLYLPNSFDVNFIVKDAYSYVETSPFKFTKLLKDDIVEKLEKKLIQKEISKEEVIKKIDDVISKLNDPSKKKKFTEIKNKVNEAESKIKLYDVIYTVNGEESELPSDGVDITFDIKNSFKFVNIYHITYNGVEEFLKKEVKNGKITIHVTSLSPFIIEEYSEKTVDNNTNGNDSNTNTTESDKQGDSNNNSSDNPGNDKKENSTTTDYTGDSSYGVTGFIDGNGTESKDLLSKDKEANDKIKNEDKDVLPNTGVGFEYGIILVGILAIGFVLRNKRV